MADTKVKKDSVDKILKKSNVAVSEVPVIKDGNDITVYMTNEIMSPIKYTILMQVLHLANENHEVRFIMNNGGGSVDSGLMLGNAIKACKAKTIAQVEGMVASASTFITLSCDKVKVGDFAQFMCHNYAYGTAGSGNQVKEYVNFTDKELSKVVKTVYKGFLSKDEIKSISQTDKEIWMGKDELSKRLEAIGKLA